MNPLPDYQLLKLLDIRANPSNPRRRFDGKDFDDFMASIREQGILQPILVRPIIHDSYKYEIIFGERRFRAQTIISDQSGDTFMDTIPALIRDLTDDEAFELMTIENIQRKDLTELEEAENFNAWIDKKGPDSLPDLADRTGIDVRYIRRRIAVLSLPKNILKAWDKGVIRYGHLEQFMRLKDKSDIKKHFKELFRWNNTAISVKELKRDIDNKAPELSCAKFDLKKTGCHACHQNTDVQKSLWNLEVSEKIKCLNPKCFKKNQNNHLLKNWKRTGFYKQHKTNGFRFKEDLSYDDYEQFSSWSPKKPEKKCKSCENFVTLINLDGTSDYPKNCIGPKSCYNELGKEKGSKTKKKKSDGPRVSWHGEYFREKFYQEVLPEKIKERAFTNSGIANTHIALYSLIKLNVDIHGWFAVYRKLRKKEPQGYFTLSDSEIFEEVTKMGEVDCNYAFREAGLQVIMSYRSSANVRHMAAQYFDIDLTKEFEITEEYCNKKTVKELLKIGEKLGIFEDPKAEAFLFEKLLKKRKNFKTCKKGELVRVFMESGVELKGKVPDEILNIGKNNG